MELSRQITIISAFGRGHWLAASLAKEGLQVTLIDVTSKLGVWPSEDSEGPFGFFRTEGLSETQIERIFSEDPFEEVANGFTLWLKKGPLEFKSPLTGFYFEKNQWPSSMSEVLSPAPNTKNLSAYRALDYDSFSKQWILHFAHQWTSTTYQPSAKAAFSGRATQLQSAFFVRSATRQGLEKSLNWLREKGIEVLTQTEVRDFSFGPGKNISGVELAGEKQGVFKTDQLIWLLTSEESYYLNEKNAKDFFPEGAIEPEWCWVRYRVKLAAGSERDSLPLHLVVITDLNSPWTHENMMVLQRTALADQFDAWVRLPNVQRFNKEYLSLRGTALCALLKERMDSSDPQIQAYPQEYSYTYSQLGASRFPIFSEEKNSRRGKSLFGNLHLSSPETWEQYTWDEILRGQEKTNNQIIQWWKNRLQKFQKSNQGKEESP